MPWRHDPSADPGAKTEGGRQEAALFSLSGLARRRQIASPRSKCAVHLISRPRFLHFTVNQYISGGLFPSLPEKKVVLYLLNGLSQSVPDGVSGRAILPALRDVLGGIPVSVRGLLRAYLEEPQAATEKARVDLLRAVIVAQLDALPADIARRLFDSFDERSTRTGTALKALIDLSLAASDRHASSEDTAVILTFDCLLAITEQTRSSAHRDPNNFLSTLKEAVQLLRSLMEEIEKSGSTSYPHAATIKGMLERLDIEKLDSAGRQLIVVTAGNTGVTLVGARPVFGWIGQLAKDLRGKRAAIPTVIVDWIRVLSDLSTVDSKPRLMGILRPVLGEKDTFRTFVEKAWILRVSRHVEKNQLVEWLRSIPFDPEAMAAFMGHDDSGKRAYIMALLRRFERNSLPGKNEPAVLDIFVEFYGGLKSGRPAGELLGDIFRRLAESGLSDSDSCSVLKEAIGVIPSKSARIREILAKLESVC